MKLDPKIISELAKLLGVSENKIIVQRQALKALVEDATKKYMVFTGTGKSAKAFVLVSSAKNPKAVKSSYDKLQNVTGKIGENLAENILRPLLIGEVDGLTYSISPYYKPLRTQLVGRELDKWRVSAPLIRWITDVAKVSQRKVTTTELDEKFIKPLQAFLQAPGLKKKYTDIASDAIKAIKDGRWQPVFVCSHNDLWLGNVLLGHGKKISLIDWDGALVDGYAFYDLMRATESLQSSKRTLRKVMEEYCAVIGCSKRQASYYLISAFAFFYTNLGDWQYERFLVTVEGCIQWLERTG